MSPRARLLAAVATGVILLLIVFVAVPYWLLTRDGMIEISVRETDPGGDSVDIRLPASLVRVAVAFAPSVRPAIDDPEVLGAVRAVRAALEALDEAPDAVFVAVDEPGTRVRIAKKDGRLIVEVDDDGDRVRIALPPAAVRALADVIPRLTGAIPEPA